MSVFKQYNQDLQYILPPSINDLLDKEHPVRLFNSIMDKLDIKTLENQYKGGGASSYHPRMLLKILVWSYLNNIYSCRHIEDCLKHNISFMFLSGMQTPDHNTIARFRGKRLTKAIKPIFISIAQELVSEGLIDIKELHIDGTKIEANANKYSFVWRKTIRYHKERILKQLNEIYDYIAKVGYLNDNMAIPDIKNIDSNKVNKIINNIQTSLDKLEKENPEIAKEEEYKKVKKRSKNLIKVYPELFCKYDEYEKTLAGRNSFSKTDTDATFMRTKDDHFMSGQLKPCYNLQIAVNNQYITNYSLYPHLADTSTLPSFISLIKEENKIVPEKIIADKGYASDENYTYLEDNSINAIIKYNTYDTEKALNKKKPFIPDNLHYNTKEDCFICPMGQKMFKIGVKEKTTDNGYKQIYDVYEAQRCEGCPLLGICHKASGNRKIDVNHKLRKYKKEIKEKFTSIEVSNLYRKRKIEVEPVFGNLKHNKKFKRFNLRGKVKCMVEMGLLCLSHNLKKLILNMNIEKTLRFA